MSILGQTQAEFGYLKARGPQVIGETPELRRIRDMPRRKWQDDPSVPELVELLTWKYRRHDVPDCIPRCAGCVAQRLKPAQAVALRDLADGRLGAFAPMRVGAGKTLATLLAGAVLGIKNTLLLVPAMAKEKTLREAAQYRRHWKIGQFQLASYEFLANPKQLDWLETIKPGLVLADESQVLKNANTKIRKRLLKFLRKHPETIFTAWTGSAGGRKLAEYAPYLRWCLRSNAPVPEDDQELKAWGGALDEKVPVEERWKPGALLQLGEWDPSEPPVTQARRAFQDRLTSTPGVISTLEDVPSCGLYLRAIPLALPPELRAMMLDMRETWRTPAGEDFTTGLDMWRHQRTLGLGLVGRWDPPAPQDWLHARRAWFAFVRDKLGSARSFDSQVHLVNRIDAGDIADGGLLAAWREIKETFVPNPVMDWFDTTVLEATKEWIQQHPQGLVWVEQKEFGERLTLETGLPYFREKAKDKQGRLIGLDYTGPAIASQHSCYKTLNLQYWHENLVTSPFSSGARGEQQIGRTHRDGQEEDVLVDFFLTSRESWECLIQAVRDAKQAEESSGALQKLVYATKDFGMIEDLTKSDDPLWKEKLIW